MRLGKDVFLALAAIVWADGKVLEQEGRALLDAARACGLSGADLEAVGRATAERTSLDAVKSLSLSPDERLFVFGIAAWLTRVDGNVAPEELATLDALGDLMGLGDRERAAASAASFAMTSFEQDVPGGSARDLEALAKEISAGA